MISAEVDLAGQAVDRLDPALRREVLAAACRSVENGLQRLEIAVVGPTAAPG